MLVPNSLIYFYFGYNEISFVQGNGQVPVTNMTNHHPTTADHNSNLQNTQLNNQVGKNSMLADYYVIYIDLFLSQL